MGKIFNYKVADITGYQLDVLGWADNLDEAKELEREYKAERGDGACILIFRYDATKGRYVEIKEDGI